MKCEKFAVLANVWGVLAMKTATAGTKPCKKMDLYFTLERRSCVNLFSTPIGFKKNLLRLNMHQQRSIRKENTKN